MQLDVPTWPMMRTTAPPIAISIVPESAAARCEVAVGKGDAGAAITTGANTGAVSPISGDCACGAGLASASRRQANSCWGLSPLRRATSETLAPGSRLSTTIAPCRPATTGVAERHP